ncbi:MAG TPA: hypothetical protein VGF59_12040, partial [Bryobacteraceae bacterium]
MGGAEWSGRGGIECGAVVELRAARWAGGRQATYGPGGVVRTRRGSGAGRRMNFARTMGDGRERGVSGAEWSGCRGIECGAVDEVRPR